MKKIFIFLLTLALMASIAACAPEQQPSDTTDTYSIYLPDGAPSLALVSTMDKTSLGDSNVTFTVVPSSTINSYLQNGTADLAIIPTNAAAILYNQGHGYRVISANTFGNLFMIGKQTVSELSGLVGKTVGVIGQGQTPDLVLRYLLGKANIEIVEGDTPTDGKVTLYYAADGASLIPLVKRGEVDFGVLGEPAVTTALTNISDASIVFDIQRLWENETGEYGFPQACLVAKAEVKDTFINALFDAINPDWAKANPTDALSRISSHMIDGSETSIKNLNETIVSNCNVGLKKSAEIKEGTLTYLSALYSLKPAAVGGKLPDENFFRIVD